MKDNVFSLDGAAAEGQPEWRAEAVALGFFDGCHLGHQRILDLCRSMSEQRAAVLTFRDHPGAAIPGRQPPALLTTLEERVDLLQRRGVTVLVKTFDRDFSTWSAERFVEELLVRRLGVRAVVVGHDYRFGHRASGDGETLAALGRRFGFSTTVVAPVTAERHGQLVISSTKIRQAIAEGALELAQDLLGRPYAVSAVVRQGAKRGRTLDFPTANQRFPEQKLQPPYGVMVVRAHTEQGQTFGGVANFGLRPTVEDGASEPLLETHLFDFRGDLYGQTLKVEFLAHLRPERKFGSLDELRQQILDDAARARQLLI